MFFGGGGFPFGDMPGGFGGEARPNGTDAQVWGRLCTSARLPLPPMAALQAENPQGSAPARQALAAAAATAPPPSLPPNRPPRTPHRAHARAGGAGGRRGGGPVNNKRYYDILGVAQDADETTMKKASRRRAAVAGLSAHLEPPAAAGPQSDRCFPHTPASAPARQQQQGGPLQLAAMPPRTAGLLAGCRAHPSSPGAARLVPSPAGAPQAGAQIPS